MQQKVLIHHEEGTYFEFVLHLAHHLEQLVAALKEVDELSLASEKRRSRTKIAAHRTAHRRDDRGGRSAFAFGKPNAHDPRLHARYDRGMPDRRVLIFAQITPHPGNARS